MRDAGRDVRQRVERLYQVSQWKAVVLDFCNSGGQADRMARRTVAALVRSLVIVVGRVAVVRMGLTIDMMAVAAGVEASVVMFMTVRTATRADFHRHVGAWCANNHGCRRERLERHRNHHEPQKDRAKADHVQNCRWTDRTRGNSSGAEWIQSARKHRWHGLDARMTWAPRELLRSHPAFLASQGVAWRCVTVGFPLMISTWNLTLSPDLT